MKYNKNFYQIRSNQEIFEALIEEQKSIGYYALPFQDISSIKEYAETVKQKHIVVIGIGGSSLGTRAIYEFLLTSNSYEKDLHFLETTDPLQINYNLNSIDVNDTHFVVISKSGTTLETISVFKYIASLVAIDSSNCTIVSEERSKLTSFAKKHDISTFELDEKIGGRFSVFSVVGLVPLAMVV